MTVKRLELKHKRLDITLMHRDYCDYLRDHQPLVQASKGPKTTPIEHRLSLAKANQTNIVTSIFEFNKNNNAPKYTALYWV